MQHAEGFNDDSVVLLICYREFSILLTGDVNTQALQTIMKGPELKPVQ
jgi:beta-lactamase superfamily II metal-dependent hydrolase